MATISVESPFEQPVINAKRRERGAATRLFVEERSCVAPAVESWRYRYLKRALDLFAAVGLIAVFLFPGLLIAAVIAISSRGPIFYREKRIGRHGVPFTIWKFRSMYQNAQSRSHVGRTHSAGAPLQWRMCKHLHDPRITPVGDFLRRWSIDEVPQLLNVVCGQMSFIGPRPIVEAEAILYGKLLSFYLAATPGVSGLWQVSGRSNVDYARRAQLDASYVSSWSPLVDTHILLRTIPAVLGRSGAR